MRLKAFIVAVGCALLLTGCGQGQKSGGDTDKRLADLEKTVGALQAQNTDLRAKLRTRSVFPNHSPLDDFFNSPGFWECTYDSSWSDCSGRCSKATGERNKLCLNLPEGPKRVQCVEQAALDGSNCLKGCPVQVSPTSLPSCMGGAGPPA